MNKPFLFLQLFDANTGLVVPEALDERVALMLCSFSAVQHSDTLASLTRLKKK